jgi:hypothetical protein
MSSFFLPGPSVLFGGALLLDSAVAHMTDFLKLHVFTRVRYKTVTDDRSLGLELWL